MKNKETNTFRDFVSPVLVLVIICFAVTFALAFSYGITKPIIDANNLKTSNEAKEELLPEAEGDFETYDGELTVLEENKIYVTDAAAAKNGSGAVITVDSNSYGGILTAMIGIDADGAVTKVKIMSASDTPGVGTKAQDSGHLAQYEGLSDLGSENIKDSSSAVDNITGASISSEAVHEAVYCALQQFDEMGGAK